MIRNRVHVRRTKCILYFTFFHVPNLLFYIKHIPSIRRVTDSYKTTFQLFILENPQSVQNKTVQNLTAAITDIRNICEGSVWGHYFVYVQSKCILILSLKLKATIS